MRLEHHLVGGYVRYISPHIIIIIIMHWASLVRHPVHTSIIEVLIFNTRKVPDYIPIQPWLHVHVCHISLH